MSLEGKTPAEINALAQLSESLASSPATRREFQVLLKKQNPNLSIPEIDTEERVLARTKPMQDEIDRMRVEREQEKAQQQANTIFEALRDGGVIRTRTEFNDLVKYAYEHGFQTTEAGLKLAAQHRATENESAEPTPMQAGLPSLLARNNKDLMKDPIGWARSEAVKAMEDLRKKNRAAGAA